MVSVSLVLLSEFEDVSEVEEVEEVEEVGEIVELGGVELVGVGTVGGDEGGDEAEAECWYHRERGISDRGGVASHTPWTGDKGAPPRAGSKQEGEVRACQTRTSRLEGRGEYYSFHTGAKAKGVHPAQK